MPTRDPWLDNAKMTLVTLVVVFHAWALLPQGVLSDQAYDFVYAWHMPAFVFVTGYLSRGFTWTGPRLWQLVHTVAVPYVVFECALALFRIHVGGERMDDLFLDPHWPLWYLAAVFFWRLLTPLFRPMWGGVVVAVATSLAAGLWAPDTFDLARVLGLLPFFVLGLKATPERLERLRTAPVQVAAAVALVGVFVLARWTDRLAGTEWLYYRARYDDLSVTDLEAFAIRSGVLLVGLVGTMAFLALVPRRGGWYTRMGGATLVVYLFHGFVVRGAEYAGFGDWAADHVPAAAVVIVVGGVALSLLLASPPVAERLGVLVDPVGWAQRRSGHAVDLSIGTKVHEATIEQLEDAVADHAGTPGDAAGSRAAAPPSRQ